MTPHAKKKERTGLNDVKTCPKCSVKRGLAHHLRLFFLLRLRPILNAK
jgi:hypothetical protein